MTDSLAKRLDDLIHSALDDYPDSFIVWCDPRGDWSPLLRRVAEGTGGQGFTLLEITEMPQDVLGGPLTRRTLQERIGAGHSFILLVTADSKALGWLWGQALLAERIYDGPCWRTDGVALGAREGLPATDAWTKMCRRVRAGQSVRRSARRSSGSGGEAAGGDGQVA